LRDASDVTTECKKITSFRAEVKLRDAAQAFMNTEPRRFTKRAAIIDLTTDDIMPMNLPDDASAWLGGKQSGE